MVESSRAVTITMLGFFQGLSNLCSVHQYMKVVQMDQVGRLTKLAWIASETDLYKLLLVEELEVRCI